MSDNRDTVMIHPDFPKRRQIVAITGSHAKLAVVEVSGKYYAPGPTPEEHLADYVMCEDLAHQLMGWCERKLPIMKSRRMTLGQAYMRLYYNGWGSPDQSLWTIQRTATLLGWPVPKGHVGVKKGAGLRFAARPRDPPKP